jgi:hypothetical protein
MKGGRTTGLCDHGMQHQKISSSELVRVCRLGDYCFLGSEALLDLVPEDRTRHNNHYENLKSYVSVLFFSFRSSGQSFWLQVQRPRGYQILWEVVGRERGPFSLVRITEEQLEWKSSGLGSRKSRLTAVGIRWADHATPSIRKSWH